MGMLFIIARCDVIIELTCIINIARTRKKTLRKILKHWLIIELTSFHPIPMLPVSNVYWQRHEQFYRHALILCRKYNRNVPWATLSFRLLRHKPLDSIPRGGKQHIYCELKRNQNIPYCVQVLGKRVKHEFRTSGSHFAWLYDDGIASCNCSRHRKQCQL